MILDLNELEKSFGEKRVLRDCSFRFRTGKIYGLLGRNGAGKTTLFNCLSDELQPDGGSARLLTPEGETRPLCVDDVGYVLSTPALPDFLTGYEFVMFFLEIHRGRAEPGRTADDYFDLVRLATEDRGRLIKGYSHGMKNKLQMLCFLISRPPVILLDEPLTSFDVVVAAEMKQLLRDIKKDHIILLSTHILQLATDLCDEIVLLSEGTLRAVDRALLRRGDFEAQIVALLREEGECHG